VPYLFAQNQQGAADVVGQDPAFAHELVRGCNNMLLHMNTLTHEHAVRYLSARNKPMVPPNRAFQHVWYGPPRRQFRKRPAEQDTRSETGRS